MNGRIGHLRNHYRVVGARGTEVALVARLDRIMREQLSATLDAALGKAFAGDDAVYVLRQVKAGTLLSAVESLADAGLARRWAERLAGAVVRSIAKDEGDGTNLVRFEDQSDYLTHFIIALLHGSAWSRWYFGAFVPLRALAAPEALRSVLLDNMRHVPAILSHLHQRGELETLLAALDEKTRDALWRDGLPDSRRADRDSLRPLFAGALRLADETGLWARARPDGEALFEIYAGSSSAQEADWRDQRSLAGGLFDILRFLLSQGYLRRADGDEGFLLQLDAALASLDWLDAVWLRSSLVSLFSGADEFALPTRSAQHGPTPRQRDLLQTLAALVRDQGLRLDHAADDSSDALRLFAMLVSRAPQWADEAAAKIMIAHLLTLGRLLQRADSPAELMLRLRRGDTEGALRSLAPAQRSGASVACAFVARLGEQACELLEELAGEVKAGARLVDGIESACAGFSLLLRAMLDTRLHTLAEKINYPPRGELPKFKALLLALGLRFGGEAASSPEGIDEGLCLLAGLRERPTLEDLRAAWTEAGEAEHELQSSLLRVAGGQRLLSAGVMHLYRFDLEGGAMALIAGDETAQVWPLGRVLKSPDEIAETVAVWLDVWEAATGVRPALVASPDDAGISQELLEAHEAGRRALRAAWQSLEHGRLDVAEADLTIFLTACLLLRVWARWLRQFSSSSVPYLLDNFIRRKGELRAAQEDLVVWLERMPLDIVIEMAGYLDELEGVPWLEHRRIRFVLRGT